ncbi:unnamed protein product [Agarophyton chilense]
MDKTSNVTEENEFVCFLGFGQNGALRWNVSIPYNVTDDFILRKVRLFLACVSMSSAVFKPYYVDPFADTHYENTRGTLRATYVNCEDNTMIVAKQIQHKPNEWQGLIIRPSRVVSEQVILSISDALEEAAEHLVRKASDSSLKFKILSECIQRLYDTDNWWRKKSLFLHLYNGLVNLGTSRGNEIEEYVKGEKRAETFPSSTTSLANLKGILLQWQRSIPSIWVASPTSEIEYYDNMTIHETKTLSWYYVSVFCIGNRERRKHYVEIVPDGTVRLWLRLHKWITVIQFTADKSFTTTIPSLLRHAADQLMDELARTHK